MKHAWLFFLTAMLCLADSRSAESRKGEWIYYPKAISGVDGEVHALAAHDSILFVGGDFKLAGKMDVRNIAAWDGHAWSALGEGLSGQINSLKVDGNGILYAWITGSHGDRISRWDGKGWEIVGDTIGGAIKGMFLDSRNRLLIHGRFTRGRWHWESKGEDPPEVEYAARWDGTSWSRLDVPGPLLADTKGNVFAYATDAMDAKDRVPTLQAYRLEDTTFEEYGSRLRFKGADVEDLRTGMDGLQRIIVSNSYTDKRGESRTQLSRLDAKGRWHAMPSNSPLNRFVELMPDRNQPSRLWFTNGGCLYELVGDSTKEYNKCHNGPLLTQMQNGQIIIAGRTISTRNHTQNHIARMVEGDWVGIDTTGADILVPLPPSKDAKMLELLQRIPVKDRPASLTENSVNDILEDSLGGLIFCGKFEFEIKGIFFRNLAYWKDGVYSSLGGGLYDPSSGYTQSGHLKMALSPDGTLYASNASLTKSGYSGKTGLHRWDGRAWLFVRTFSGDMFFDRQGNMDAFCRIQEGSLSAFCRIPLDSPEDSVEIISEKIRFDRNGVTRIKVDDSLAHLYGDFLRAGASLSPGHAAWRIPDGPGRKRVLRKATAIPDANRILIVQEDRDEVYLQDSNSVEQAASYTLYNSTGEAFDTVYLEMPHIDSLRMETSSRGKPSTLIPASDYTISPHLGGYRLKVCIRDSITTKKTVSLHIRTHRKGLLSRLPPDGYLFQDTLHRLVANRYDDGGKEPMSIHVRVGRGFPIQGRRHLKDTLVKNGATGAPIRWKILPDPERLADPFFKGPEHKSRWYSHLLGCESNRKRNLMEDDTLPAGLTRERVYRDLWRYPIAPSDSEVEVGCSVYAVRWEAKKDTSLLVFLETTAYFDPAQGGMDEQRNLRIGVYRWESEGNLRLAAAMEPMGLMGRELVASIDVESFRLTEKESAFGIRLEEHSYGARYSEGHNSSLALFRLEGETIKPILSTLMSSYVSGIEESGEWERDGGSATLTVLKHKTQGVYDLKKAVRGKASAIFKWAGGYYELNGKDPVKNVN